MRLLSRMKFRTKIGLGISLIVAVIAVVLSLLVGRIAGRAMVEESKKRGLALAENLSLRATDPLLAMDYLRLKNMVDEMEAVSEDIEYAFVQDATGRVVVHTFKSGFPVDLQEVNTLGKKERSSILLLDTGRVRIYDFAVKVGVAGDGIGTVRIGLSRSKIQQVVNRVTMIVYGVSGAILLASMLLSAQFARRITKRLNRLQEQAERVVQGNLDLQTGPPLSRNCWEIMDCNLEKCPAYGDSRRRCWYQAGTMCAACSDLEYPEKTESCRKCPVYKQNVGDEIQDLAESFDVMALTLNSHIEELKEAEKVLTRQQRLMRTILDVTPDLVCLLDENRVYLAANKAFAEFISRSVDEIVGKTDAELFPKEVAAERCRENTEVLADGRARHKEQLVRHNDREYWFHTVTMPVLDRDGRNIGIMRSSRDITEIKKYQAQLIQAQKMESVGKLAGGVAHEINTPLGIILGYAQLLQEDVEKDDAVYNDLLIIEKQAKVCRKIVSDLLGFSRQTESAKREMCFNNSVMEAVSLVRHTFQLDHVEIRTELDDRMPIIYGDPEKLKQVWINLLNNARDAIADGGVIVVGSRLNSKEQSITAWFSDSGSGISKDDLQRIFDPFFSTKPVGKGTGLGLSVSFGIIEDHGGEIRAQSPLPAEFRPAELPEGTNFGPGTVVLVELPLEHEDRVR